jgi:hypothetical protein
MNYNLLIKLTNRIALLATAALIYWVFIFLTITVFDLIIFRERTTEMFFLSLLGIFAILGGSLVLNVMSNLSKISAGVSSTQNPGGATAGRGSRWRLVIAGASFPIIAALLFAGHELSEYWKRALLIRSAEKLVAENQTPLVSLAAYQFSPEFIRLAESTLSVINKIDRNFPTVMLILPDQIEGKSVLLGFGEMWYGSEKKKTDKIEYIISTSDDERDYLFKVFAGTETNYRFRAEKGKYELYFPTTVGDKTVVLYFSDFQRYGKYGS